MQSALGGLRNTKENEMDDFGNEITLWACLRTMWQHRISLATFGFCGTDLSDCCHNADA